MLTDLQMMSISETNGEERAVQAVAGSNPLMHYQKSTNCGRSCVRASVSITGTPWPILLLRALGFIISYCIDFSGRIPKHHEDLSDAEKVTRILTPSKERFPHMSVVENDIGRDHFGIDIQGSAYLLPPLSPLICSKTTRSLFQSGSGTTFSSSSSNPPPICPGGAGRAVKLQS